MATIKAACPSCGVIRLSVTQLRVVFDDDSNHAYRFECPQCTRSIANPITPAIGALLRSVGVEAVRQPFQLTDQFDEAGGMERDRADRPAFTADDVTDFQHLLKRDDWFDQLVASTPTEGDS